MIEQLSTFLLSNFTLANRFLHSVINENGLKSVFFDIFFVLTKKKIKYKRRVLGIVQSVQLAEIYHSSRFSNQNSSIHTTHFI